MISLESWERARYEEELVYYARFFQRDGDRLPLEYLLILERGGQRVTITFLLIASPYGLAYESLERVHFKPEDKPLVTFGPQVETGEYWRILV